MSGQTQVKNPNPKQQWLYLIRPARLGMLTEGPTPVESDTVNRHFSYLEQLCQQGQVILVGRTQTSDQSTFGIVIFEADDESAARLLMEHDPAVSAGVMKAELYPYSIALHRE